MCHRTHFELLMACAREPAMGKNRGFGVVWGSRDIEKSCSALKSACWKESGACLDLQGPSPAPRELHHDAQTSLAFTSHSPALCRLWNSPLARQQWCSCREAPTWLLLQEQLLLLWVNLHRTGPLAEVHAHKGGIKTIQVTSLIHTLTFL